MFRTNRTILMGILCALMVVCVSLGITGFTNSQTAYASTGGRYGDINWSIEGDTLKISPVSGTDGAMADITSYDEAPWYKVDGKYSYNTIRSIIIEDGVSHIGTEAFCYFDKITRIDIPKSCKTVSREAFYNCENLKEVTMYGNVGYYTFAYCYSLERVTVISNESGQIIAEGAFYDCESLKEATILVQDICEDAFCYCYALENLNLLEGCMNIRNEAFYKCQSLKNLYLPSSLAYIDREAFYDCRSLKQITYNGSKNRFNNINFNKDYNDVIVEALNFENGRKIIYKATGIYNYIDEFGNVKSVDGSKEECYYLNKGLTNLENCWYIVDGEHKLGFNRITTTGVTNILLLNKSLLENSRGIQAFSGALYIYSESLDENTMGRVNITGSDISGIDGPGIVNICGGKITVKGDLSGIGAPTINIYNGNINAKGGRAGIGGSSTINIYNGKVYAEGGDFCAGIGSSKWCNSTINIYGGDVTGKANCGAAGIGSGKNGDCTLNIYGGKITGTLGDFPSIPIGSGQEGHATVNIYGGDISGTIASVGEIDIGTPLGYCEINNYRNGKNKGTGTFMSSGSLTILFGILAGVFLVTTAVFMTLYFRKKKS